MPVSDREVELVAMRTYGYLTKVLFEFLGDFVSEFATRYWLAFPSPVLCVYLPPRG